MENEFPEPIIVVSKCLGFAACRYNGKMLESKLIEKLKNYAQIIPVCPEVEIGLNIPRSPLILVKKNNHIELIQPETEKNLTEKMNDFTDYFLNEKLTKVDGFILKNRSPSCGIKDCKLYFPENHNPVGKTDGLFAAKVQKIYPYTAIQGDDGLANFKTREHFLIKIFVLARFRKIKNINELIEFHTKNKYLLMPYDQKLLKKMGRLTANPAQLLINEIINKYGQYLKKTLYQPAEDSSCINVLMHIFGYFSDQISQEEKHFFLKTLEKYRKSQVPLRVPLNILKEWTQKYEQPYLKKQTFLNLYLNIITKLRLL